MEQLYNDAVSNSLQSIMKMMVGIDVQQGKSYEKDGSAVLANDSITAIISLNSETIHYTVALTLPMSVISMVAEKMLPGIDLNSAHAMLVDLVGELSNMVVGGAKNALDESGSLLNLSLPVVVSGKDYCVEFKVDSPVIVIEFDSDFGSVYLETSLKVQ